MQKGTNILNNVYVNTHRHKLGNFSGWVIEYSLLFKLFTVHKNDRADKKWVALCLKGTQFDSKPPVQFYKSNSCGLGLNMPENYNEIFRMS